MPFTLLAQDVLYFSSVTPRVYWGNETKKQTVKDAYCDLTGVPKTDEGWQAIKNTMVPFTTVSNIVGNYDLGLPGGIDVYYVCAPITKVYGVGGVSNVQFRISYDMDDLPTNCVKQTTFVDIQQKIDDFRAATTNICITATHWTALPKVFADLYGLTDRDGDNP